MYQQAINLLTSQGKFHISLGLERISKVLELLGNPQNDLKIIHVAGTNGKGSTCAMLASVLKESSYKTGMYTSPHLIEYTERVQINNRQISKDDFADLVIKVINLADDNGIHLTEFEILTVVAFLYFKSQQVDIAVIEVGLGGRLDATNVVTPLLSVITSIDIDHKDRLGSTIEQIAPEKAGIIKQNTPVVTLFDNNGLDIIKQSACVNRSKIILANYSNYKIEGFSITTPHYKFEMGLLGLWQVKNLSLVLSACNELNSLGFNINLDHLKTGLKKAVWPSRFQYFKDENIILDGAHNVAAAKALRQSLDFYFPNKPICWIYGSLSTKDYKSVIKELIAKEDVVICSEVNSKYSVSSSILVNEVKNNTNCNKIFNIPNVKKAIGFYNNNHKKSFTCVVAGSFYVTGEALQILHF